MGKTNFMLIVADDMGFSDAGCYGGEISTPNLDRLGRNGLRFTQHYSAGRCWPSRACILTGQYYQQVPNHPEQGPLPNWGRTIPHYLKPEGYRCYHSGKWHVNQVPTILEHGGFDRSYHIRDYDRNFAVRDHQLDGESLPPAAPRPSAADAPGHSPFADGTTDEGRVGMNSRTLCRTTDEDPSGP